MSSSRTPRSSLSTTRTRSPARRSRPRTTRRPGMPEDAGGAERDYLRIATEEAYAPPEMIDLYRSHLATDDVDDVGFTSLMGYFLGSEHPQPRAVVERLQDAGERRIEDMDAAGIDHQVLALTAPGT